MISLAKTQLGHKSPFFKLFFTILCLLCVSLQAFSQQEPSDLDQKKQHLLEIRAALNEAKPIGLTSDDIYTIPNITAVVSGLATSLNYVASKKLLESSIQVADATRAQSAANQLNKPTIFVSLEETNAIKNKIIRDKLVNEETANQAIGQILRYIYGSEERLPKYLAALETDQTIVGLRQQFFPMYEHYEKGMAKAASRKNWSARTGNIAAASAFVFVPAAMFALYQIYEKGIKDSQFIVTGKQREKLVAMANQLIDEIEAIKLPNKETIKPTQQPLVAGSVQERKTLLSDLEQKEKLLEKLEGDLRSGTKILKKESYLFPLFTQASATAVSIGIVGINYGAQAFLENTNIISKPGHYSTKSFKDLTKQDIVNGIRAGSYWHRITLASFALGAIFATLDRSRTEVIHLSDSERQSLLEQVSQLKTEIADLRAITPSEVLLEHDQTIKENESPLHLGKLPSKMDANEVVQKLEEAKSLLEELNQEIEAKQKTTTHLGLKEMATPGYAFRLSVKSAAAMGVITGLIFTTIPFFNVIMPESNFFNTVADVSKNFRKITKGNSGFLEELAAKEINMKRVKTNAKWLLGSIAVFGATKLLLHNYDNLHEETVYLSDKDVEALKARVQALTKQIEELQAVARAYGIEEEQAPTENPTPAPQAENNTQAAAVEISRCLASTENEQKTNEDLETITALQQQIDDFQTAIRNAKVKYVAGKTVYFISNYGFYYGGIAVGTYLTFVHISSFERQLMAGVVSTLLTYMAKELANYADDTAEFEKEKKEKLESYLERIQQELSVLKQNAEQKASLEQKSA
ncbi:MAG: hypothetical protein AB7F43_14025 [Bacteriovoracia bacterium]